MEAEDAIKAMLDGGTLYDMEGNPRRFSDDEIESFMSLYRIPPKRKRPMTYDQLEKIQKQLNEIFGILIANGQLSVFLRVNK
jgi:hypothetical protein